MFLTPPLSVFHNGTYTGFQVGTAASPELEAIAEEGMVGAEITRIDGLGIGAKAAVATGALGSGSTAGQPPVLDAGEKVTFTIDFDPSDNRNFSFLSMVIPSNDTFIGNADRLSYELFDDLGAFRNLSTILVDGADICDGGTEENDGLGAAFSAAGGMATPTVGGRVQSSPVDFLFGPPTVAACTFSEPVPIPVPAALPLLLAGLGGLGIAARRLQRG